MLCVSLRSFCAPEKTKNHCLGRYFLIWTQTLPVLHFFTFPILLRSSPPPSHLLTHCWTEAGSRREVPATGGWWGHLAIQHPRVKVLQKSCPEPLTVPEKPATALLHPPTSKDTEMASPHAWADTHQRVQNQRFPAV